MRPISNPAYPARLALVITELEVGGAERALTNLALGLDRASFDPVVYSLWGRPAAEQSALVERLEAANIPVRFVNLRRAAQLRTGVNRLQKMLAEQKPQLLQAFLFHANVIGAYAAWRLKVPRIVLGMRVADRSAWRVMMERIAARVADRIVCVSDSVRTFAETEAHLPKEKLHVIHNGVDVDRFETPSAVNSFHVILPSERRVIAVIGRLHRQKGIDWLLPLLQRVFTEVPDVDLAIAGEGPERTNLQGMCRSLGIADRVHFLGWLPNVRDLLHRSSVLVLPSRWEGFPNVLLEAMAAGKPVVAVRVEGVGELLGSFAQAQSIPPGEGDELVRALIALLRDPVRAQELGRHNRERVRSEFSTATMVARYEHLYRDLIEGC